MKSIVVCTCLLLAGSYAGALHAAETAPEKTDIDVLLKRAETQIAGKKYQAAVKTATKAIRNSPRNAQAFLLRGKARVLGEKDLMTGEFWLIDGLAWRVDGVKVVNLARWTPEAKGKSAAFVDVSRAIELGCKQPERTLILARALMQEHNYRHAKRHLDAVIKQEPKNAEAYYRRAACNMILWDQNGGNDDIDRLITIGKPRIEYLRLGCVNHLFGKGLRHFAVHVDKALEADKTNADLYEIRGVMHEQLKKLDAALADYQTANRLEPDRVPHLLNLASVFGRRKEPARALPYLAHGFKIATTRRQRFELLRKQCRAHSRLKHYDKAMQDVKAFLELARTTRERRDALNYRRHILANTNQIALAFKDMDRIKSLEKILKWEKHLEFDPHNPEPLCELAALHRKSKLYPSDKAAIEKAIEFYDKALVVDPQWVRAFYGRLEMRMELRDYQKALSDCNAIIRLRPNSNDGYLHRAAVYFQLKKYDQAIADFEKGRAFGTPFAAAYLARAKQREAAGQKKLAAEDRRRAAFLDPSLKLDNQAAKPSIPGTAVRK